jgi:hypothetical protein
MVTSKERGLNCGRYSKTKTSCKTSIIQAKHSACLGFLHRKCSINAVQYPEEINEMLPVLYNSPEFKHLPSKQRWKAAWLARQRASRHWQMWASIVALFVLVFLGSITFEYLWNHRWSSSVGATIGAIFGFRVYERTLFRFGYPYYREILLKDEML